MKGSFKKALERGDLLIGATIVELGRPSVIKVLNDAGFDFIFLEYEHASLSSETVADIITTGRDVDLPTIVKLPALERHFVTKILDAGAMGIQLPRTNSKEEIAKLVQWSKFPPIGDRAACPGLGNTDYQLTVELRDFLVQANERTIVAAHIETKAGLENLDDILSNEHLDVAFVGPYDLSIDLGVPGQWTDPGLVREVQRVIDKARARKIAPGIAIWDLEISKMWIERGMQLIEFESALGLIYAGSVALLRELGR